MEGSIETCTSRSGTFAGFLTLSSRVKMAVSKFVKTQVKRQHSGNI